MKYELLPRDIYHIAVTLSYILPRIKHLRWIPIIFINPLLMKIHSFSSCAHLSDIWLSALQNICFHHVHIYMIHGCRHCKTVVFATCICICLLYELMRSAKSAISPKTIFSNSHWEAFPHIIVKKTYIV